MSIIISIIVFFGIVSSTAIENYSTLRTDFINFPELRGYSQKTLRWVVGGEGGGRRTYFKNNGFWAFPFRVGSPPGFTSFRYFLPCGEDTWVRKHYYSSLPLRVVPSVQPNAV
jgi:hypothetical protein